MMNKILILLLLAPAAWAQTNLPGTNAPARLVVHPAFLQYRAVTNQIAVVQRQIRATNEIHAAQITHILLRCSAGELSRDASRQEQNRVHDQQRAAIKPLKMQLARLQLSAYEIKTKYGFDKLPNPPKAKK
jgi:hypothetical protein